MGLLPVAQRVHSLCIFAVLVVVSIISLYHGGYLASLYIQGGTPRISGKDRPPLPHNLGDLLFELYKPIKLPADATSYTDRDGKEFGTEGHDYWKTPMGSDILIVDIDTRIPDGKNGIFSASKMNWNTLETSGAGLLTISHLNHYLYSQIHGYDYLFFHARKIEGHWDTWIKPHVFQRLLRDHRFVVFVDADAVIQHPEVPLEFLMNRWNIAPNTSIAMPIDTQQLGDNKENISTDSKGRVVLNTGFVVLQNLPHTHEMLQAWTECTTEKRYPGCGQWKQRWSHEQRAFSEYIRYDFNPQGNNIVEIPCADANGYPGLFGSAGVIDDCQGNFLRHYTLNKGRAKASTTDVLMQSLSEVLQKNFEKNHEVMLIEENEE